MYWILCSFLLLIFNMSFAVQNNKEYSATDSLGIAELTLEEMQLYQSEFLPLSLAEKGRQSVTAWRGMPPGYLDYEFEHVPLTMPLWGYWDNQLLPIEFIRQRRMETHSLNYYLIPKNINVGLKPVTRIAYSQDIQFGLSYIDINFHQFYRSKSFFHLSGNNFLRTGSAASFTEINVNTYRGQIHHQFSEKLNIDLWYWQVRHSFYLSPFPVVREIEHIHRIGQVLWLNIHYLPDSTSSVILTPYGYKWGDRYRNQDYSIQRKTEMYSLGLKLQYQKRIESGNIEIVTNLVRHKITKAFVYSLEDQWDGKFNIKSDYRWRFLIIKLTAGYRFIQGVGKAPNLNFGLGWQMPLEIYSELAFASKPQNLPLSSLFWNGYSINPLNDPQVPIRQGAEWRLEYSPWQETKVMIAPYYYRFQNAWGYDPILSNFIQKKYDNSGIMASIQTRLIFLGMENQITYNANYQGSFIPQFRNVFKINLPLSLFKGALKLDSYLIYHFIGKWSQLDYDPFVNHYLRTDNEDGNFHIVDAKILAHVKTATLFFVWDNLLSQDYAIVNGYQEVYRMFRFGIYWTLFD